MNSFRFGFLLLLCFALSFAGKAQKLNTTPLDQLITAEVQEDGPGVAVGVVQNGQIIYEQYAGLANLEHRVPIGPTSRFNIASNAKQFTALCILKLIEEGKIKLEDDFRTHLPQFFPNQAQQISIAHLLNHTSGIRDVYDLWALQGITWWRNFFDNKDAIELLKSQQDLNFAPGTDYLYSNSNYILLSEIVSRITEKDFADYAQEVFSELGMPNTSFLTNYMQVVPGKARPYGNWNGWIEYPTITELHADGGLYTNLADQLGWELLLQKNEGKLLDPQLVQQSQSPLPASAHPNYGYGLMLDTYRGLDYAYHDGNTGAYNATFLRFPSENLAVVVMSNNSNIATNQLAKRVAEQFIRPEQLSAMEYPIGPEEIIDFPGTAQVLGDYLTEGGTLIQIFEQDGDLYRGIYQREAVRLIPEKGNLFQYETNKDLKMAFAKNENGEQTFTIYYPGQIPNVGVKLPKAEVSEKERVALPGTYYNEELQVEVELMLKEGNTFTVSQGEETMEAALLRNDLLKMGGYNISISRNPMAKVEGLLLAGGRLRNVWFKKIK